MTVLPGFAATQGMHLGARLFDFGEGEAGAARQFFGRARGRDAETRLLEQWHAEYPLELTRGAMDARLRHLARPRGDAEIAVPDHSVERFELRRTDQPFRSGDTFGGGAACGFTERVAQLGQRALDAAQTDFPRLC